MIVYQVFDNDTDAVMFNGVPFATAELAQERIDRTVEAVKARGWQFGSTLVVRESEVCEQHLPEAKK